MIVKRWIVGPFQTNCYLLITAEELGLIDPGGDSNIILEEIANQGLKLNYIINTHYHIDHISANAEIKNATGAKILIHKAESEYISRSFSDVDGMGGIKCPEFSADQLLAGGDIIRVGSIKLKVVHTPGHSAGSICLLGEGIIFTGDTLFCDGCGRTDLPGGSDEAMRQSLRKLNKIIKPGMKVYPGHGKIFHHEPRMIGNILGTYL